MSQALFSSTIVAKCRKTLFFHLENGALARISGFKEGPQERQKANFWQILNDFQCFWASLGDQKWPKMSFPGSLPRRPPGRFQGASGGPRRPKIAQNRLPKWAFQVAPRRPQGRPQGAPEGPRRPKINHEARGSQKWFKNVRFWLRYDRIWQWAVFGAPARQFYLGNDHFFY